MLRLFAAVTTLALATPVIAQDTAPSPAQPPVKEMPAPSSDPAPDTPSSAPVQSAPKTKEETIKEVVSAEFPSYDADKSGDLNKVEFGKWVTTLREQTMAQQGKPSTMSEAEKTSWVKNAFAKADADKSKKVSQAELETFLMG